MLLPFERGIVFSFSHHDDQIAARTATKLLHRVNSRAHQLRSVGEAAISLQHWFTLFLRDDSSDYRIIPNVTFTVCNRLEFHDLATLPTQVMAYRNPPIIYTHSVFLNLNSTRCHFFFISTTCCWSWAPQDVSQIELYKMLKLVSRNVDQIECYMILLK
jgi:hypothetical protein